MIREHTWEKAFSRSHHHCSTNQRFRQLPHWCGACDALPGVAESPEWQDWTKQITTPDQLRIEETLESCLQPTDCLLHIGVGNSSLAKRFGLRCAQIDGLTIGEPEQEYSRTIGIENYSVIKRSKYDPDLLSALPAKSYNYIIDNNPTTFSCCRTHLSSMLANYVSLLAPEGTVLTDKVGLSWTSSPNDARWGISVDEWFAIGQAVGLSPVRRSGHVIGLCRRLDASE